MSHPSYVVFKIVTWSLQSYLADFVAVCAYVCAYSIAYVRASYCPHCVLTWFFLLTKRSVVQVSLDDDCQSVTSPEQHVVVLCETAMYVD